MTGEEAALASARDLWDEIHNLVHVDGQTEPTFTTDQVTGDYHVTYRVACVADFVDALGCHVTIVTVHRHSRFTPESEDRK
jgi:hypothetical protein